MECTPPAELWLSFGHAGWQAWASRENAAESAAAHNEQNPQEEPWGVARYELAAGLHRAPQIPVAALWLDAEAVGVMIGARPRQVRERIALRADFPRPVKIGTPRWNAGEVDAWMRRQREADAPRRRTRKAA